MMVRRDAQSWLCTFAGQAIAILAISQSRIARAHKAHMAGPLNKQKSVLYAIVFLMRVKFGVYGVIGTD